MSSDLEESGPALARRVAALEAAVDRLLNPVMMVAEFPPMSEAEEQQFREEFEAAAAPSSVTVLDPDTVRALLRECVTVVKPGEVLILRAADDMTPEHVRDIHEVVDAWLAHNAPAIRALVVPPMEIAIVPAGEVPA